MEEEEKDDNNNDEVNKGDEVDKNNADEVDKDNEVDKDTKEEEEIVFAKILKITKYTSLPNLVRLAQWNKLVNTYYIHTTTTTSDIKDEVEPSSPTQL